MRARVALDRHRHNLDGFLFKLIAPGPFQFLDGKRDILAVVLLDVLDKPRPRLFDGETRELLKLLFRARARLFDLLLRLLKLLVAALARRLPLPPPLLLAAGGFVLFRPPL